VDRTRRWQSVFRGLPPDLWPPDLPAWIQADDSESVIAFLEVKCQEAFDEERAFEEQHPEARYLAKVYLRRLSDGERAQAEWFRDEQSQRHERTRRLREGLRLAKDIAGVEPYDKPRSDDDLE
jgi:hypothetical protein